MDERFGELKSARVRQLRQPVAVLVDLGRVRSKYGSETEKAMAELFDAAEREGWTLVFDEADELFGRRTEVADAHDRYAHLDVALLLQRIERHSKVLVAPTSDPQEATALVGFAVRHFPPL